MRAMVIERPGEPLVLEEVPVPEPGPGQLRLRVQACGVCRTDLHVVDGELPEPKLPLVPGHQIVGVAEERRRPARRGPWLGWTCGECPYCRSGPREPLRRARASPGYHIDGGYAEHGRGRRALLLPRSRRLADAQAAPLLCAGLIGYRSLRLAGDAGASASTASAPPPTSSPRSRATQGRRVFAFTRAGDDAAQAFARGARRRVGRRLGRARRPSALDAAIIFAPVGALVPAALRARRERRHRGLRRHPHERHPGLSLRAPLGGARAPLGRQPHAAGRRGVPGARARVPVRTHVETFPLERRTRRSSGSAPGRSSARR